MSGVSMKAVIVLGIALFSATSFAKGSFTGPCAEGAAAWAREKAPGLTVDSSNLSSDGSYFLAVTTIAADGSIDEAALTVSAATACRFQLKK